MSTTKNKNPARFFSVAGDLKAEPLAEAWKPSLPDNNNTNELQLADAGKQRAARGRQRRGERGARTHTGGGLGALNETTDESFKEESTDELGADAEETTTATKPELSTEANE